VDTDQLATLAAPLQVANVDRALTLIETLAERPDGAPLGELAAGLGLPKSALHRLLQSLVQRGYVSQEAGTQHYLLTLKVGMLGFRLLDGGRLPDLAQRALDDLAARSSEYCRIALVEGESLYWAARAQGATQGLRYEPPMGRDVVLHATATGKAWLATLPEDDALRIVLRRGFGAPRRLGVHAVDSIDALRRHLRETRRRGYAFADDEAEPGIVAIATTFRAHGAAGAEVAGTVSIAGPKLRLPPPRIATLAPLLSAAASSLTEMWPMRRRQRAAPTTSVKPAVRAAGKR
jgi:DNA-binding IclR family transcriptional regulator